jgi:hypothetical protein
LLIGAEPFAVGGLGEDVAGLGQPLAFLDQHGKGGLVALHLFEGGIENLRPFHDDRGGERVGAEQGALGAHLGAGGVTGWSSGGQTDSLGDARSRAEGLGARAQK